MNNPLHTFRPLLSAIFLTICGVFVATQTAQASHIIGGEISYKCIGGNQYEIILDVYRDCFNGIPPFDAPAHIGIYTESGLYVNNLNLQPMDIDTLPNNIAGDPCLFVPENVCVERARYKGTYTLTSPTGGFYFVYQRCCRNMTISNITMPDSTGASYFVFLSAEARATCNDSPVFGFNPPVFVCVNKPINQPFSATDEQGDSLSYKLYTPFKGGTYNAPQPGIPDASALSNADVESTL